MAGKSSKTQRVQRISGTRFEVTKEPTSADRKTRTSKLSTSGSGSSRWHQNVWLVSILGVLIGGAMIVLSIMSVSRPATVPASAAAPPVQSDSLASGGDPRSKGSANAPVVIVEWFDFQCPACGQFARTIEPEIDRLYVESGKARFVARNFSFLGPESFLAAEAAQEAARQGRYWAFYNLVFQNQRGENLGAFSIDNLKRFGTQAGLDAAALNAAMDGRTNREVVLNETKQGQAQGVNATPTFFINGRLVRGVLPLEEMKKIIDQELAKKQ